MPSPIQLLTVENSGPQQVLRADCTLIKSGLTFCMEWDYRDVRTSGKLPHGRHRNLIIAAAGETRGIDHGHPYEMKWIAITGLSADGQREEKQRSMWNHGDKLPECDIKITVTSGNRKPHIECFTVRAGRTSALEIDEISKVMAEMGQRGGQARAEALRIAGRMNKLLAVLLLSTLSALAQDQPASPHKSAKATQKSLPVSKYLRKVGLLYLQTIEDVSKHCEGLIADPAAHRECSAAMESWDSTLDQIESMVDIELNDSKFSGDIPTWYLLKYARMSKSTYLIGYSLAGFMQTADGGKAMMDLWGAVYPTCETYAHETVVDGTYISDGGCAELVKKAMNHKPAPQTISEELRAKCTPFADGSVEKVLAKTMPLPPHECREALGWMRDTRLDTLYRQPGNK